MTYDIISFSDRLYLICLEPPLRGFGRFLGTWLYKGEYPFIVDPGPTVTSGLLMDALKALGVKRLSHILLTHIHIDHAGGIREISDHFKDAPIICHEEGIPHLVNPEKLYEGSVKTLGKTAQIYGPIFPVPENRFIAAQNFSHPGITPVITPGHAAHHVSYMARGYLFAGEAGGVSLPIEDGGFYMRPATPPRFFMETYVKSIDALIQMNPEAICYGHFGLRENGRAMLEKNRSQLFLWQEEIAKALKEHGEKSGRYETITRILLGADPNLEGFHRLDEAKREREKGFIKNSIMGFEGYLNRS